MKGTAPRTEGRTESRTESLLRPREIQVRIRSGQSPETVAAAAQTTVERVMAFATPVLAERAFVAQQAAKASVRRRAGDGHVGLLGDAVAARLEAAGLDPDSADWDAWRREDGRWTVVAEYAEAGESRQAEFTYDAIGRYVVAEDDTARWLVGERRAVAPTPEPEIERASPAYAALADQEPDGQLALGEDALRVVTGRPLNPVPSQVPSQVSAPVSAPVGLTAVEAIRVEAIRVEVPVEAAQTEEPTEEPTEDLTTTADAVRAVAAPPAEGEGLFEDTDPAPRTETAGGRRSHPTSRPRARRSMPSWDDIMLGSAPRGD